MVKLRAVTIFVSILLFIIALCFTCFQPTIAQNHSVVTIAEDSSINAIMINENSIKPSTAPILREGTIYTLTDDISAMIVITKSNITFNGNGHTINQYSSYQDNSDAYGIILSQVFNVTVTNTTIINSGNGIYAIQNPTAGIKIDYGDSNILTRNNIMNNFNGILLFETKHNKINQNNITNSNNPYGVGYGIEVWGASDNKIYQNNFIDNESPAQIADFDSQSLRNSWDNGKEGNFWDDYTGTDANSDGIGDTPYEIYTKNRSGALFPKNTDSYPLIKPFNSTLHLLKTTPPKITVLSPLNEVYNESSVSLTFITDKALESMTYNVDGEGNQAIAGNLTLPELPNGLHNLTIYAKDTYGNNASQTVDFSILVPEFSENTAPIGVVILVVAITVCVVSVLLYRRHRKNANPSLIRRIGGSKPGMCRLNPDVFMLNL